MPIMAALPGRPASVDTSDLCKPPLSDALVKQRKPTKHHTPEVPEWFPSCYASGYTVWTCLYCDGLRSHARDDDCHGAPLLESTNLLWHAQGKRTRGGLWAHKSRVELSICIRCAGR